MASDQLTFDDPTKRHAHIEPKSQSQKLPGLDRDLDPKPDKGEDTYRGTGRLKGRKALVTGGDSGIGAAVAIAFAREGADVVITYLPSEQPDAEHVGEVIEKDGGKVALIPGDIREREFCRKLVSQSVEALGGLDILVNNAGHQVFQEDFDSDITLDAKLNILSDVMGKLRSHASSFGSNLSIVENRTDFTKAMINTLETGAANLTLADTNEEAANLLALQTRQQLSSTALSMASQADQAVLRLFG